MVALNHLQAQNSDGIIEVAMDSNDVVQRLHFLLARLAPVVVDVERHHLGVQAQGLRLRAEPQSRPATNGAEVKDRAGLQLLHEDCVHLESDSVLLQRLTQPHIVVLPLKELRHHVDIEGRVVLALCERHQV